MASNSPMLDSMIVVLLSVRTRSAEKVIKIQKITRPSLRVTKPVAIGRSFVLETNGSRFRSR